MDENEKYEWKPWQDFAKKPGGITDGTLLVLPLDEPPCKHCRFWKPLHCPVGERDGISTTIRCCWAEEMYNDFSCFKSVPEQPRLTVIPDSGSPNLDDIPF